MRRRRMPRNAPEGTRCGRCGQRKSNEEEKYLPRVLEPGQRARPVCEPCRKQMSAAERAKTGARLLSQATITGTSDRDGKVFTVIQLPAKRRNGNR